MSVSGELTAQWWSTMMCASLYASMHGSLCAPSWQGVADVIITGRTSYYGLRACRTAGSMLKQLVFGFAALAALAVVGLNYGRMLPKIAVDWLEDCAARVLVFVRIQEWCSDKLRQGSTIDQLLINQLTGNQRDTFDKKLAIASGRRPQINAIEKSKGNNK
jgi:hypothetical protein